MDAKTAALGCVATYLIFLMVKNVSSPKHETRKSKLSFTPNEIDKQIGRMNHNSGVRIPNNFDVPHYSRQNYNRRHRPIVKNYF